MQQVHEDLQLVHVVEWFGVVSLLSWCCVNKNLCREEIYAATTQEKISLQDLPRVKTVNQN